MKEEKCKWNYDGFCVNDECPYRADFCPVIDFLNTCKFYEQDDKKVKDNEF